MQWFNIQWNDSDNILIPDQGQAAETGERLQRIKFWECMMPWLGYNSCGQSSKLICNLILFTTYSDPQEDILVKSSESSHFKISNKTINKCITWGTVSCFCHIQLSVLMLIYTSWEPAPLYFIYSCSPLKNRQVHLVIFPRLLKSVTKLLLNFFDSVLCSFSAWKKLLCNLQRFQWT